MWSPKKQTQNKPKQSQFPKSQNECKLTYNKGLQKKRRFRSPTFPLMPPTEALNCANAIRKLVFS